MQFLLIPMGSAGDMHPFVGLGLELQRRGGNVTLLSLDYFEPMIRTAGLPFASYGSADEYLRITQNPDLWHPHRAFKVVAQEGILRLLDRVFPLIADHSKREPTVVVAPSTLFAARVAREVLPIRLVTIHLQPACLRSNYEMPITTKRAFPTWTPIWAKRGLNRLIDFLVNGIVAKETNRFRAGFGLPPRKRLLWDWWHSPDLVVGMFPDWFATPQPDWPPQTRLTSFPLWDEAGVTSLPPAVEEFLEAGEPPMVFTPGSAMRHAGWFFEASAEACRLSRRRGILLTRFTEQLPAALPPNVASFDYVPFSALLPRAAAVVHHGGIGSCAQGLAAGIPQLIMPLAHDQFDNAARLQRLGVGLRLDPEAYTSKRVAERLTTLLSDPDRPARCRTWADRLAERQGIREAVDQIESLADAWESSPCSATV